MNFGQALEAVKNGMLIQRDGWNGKGMYVELQVPDAHSKMTRPYLFLHTPNDRIPWLASQADVLAEDWRAIYK